MHLLQHSFMSSLQRTASGGLYFFLQGQVRAFFETHADEAYRGPLYVGLVAGMCLVANRSIWYYVYTFNDYVYTGSFVIVDTICA